MVVVRVILRVLLSVSHAGNAVSLSLVAVLLEVGEYREREVYVVAFRPYDCPVGRVFILAVQSVRSERQRHLVLVVILAQVATETYEARQVGVVQIGDIVDKLLGMHKHLKALVLAHIEPRLLIDSSRVVWREVGDAHLQRLLVLLTHLSLARVALTLDARRQDIIDRSLVGILLHIHN